MEIKKQGEVEEVLEQAGTGLDWMLGGAQTGLSDKKLHLNEGLKVMRTPKVTVTQAEAAQPPAEALGVRPGVSNTDRGGAAQRPWVSDLGVRGHRQRGACTEALGHQTWGESVTGRFGRLQRSWGVRPGVRVS